MIWFVRDLDLLNLLLRALSFALEAVAFGALFFWGVVARPEGLDPTAEARLRHVGARFALALALTEIVLLATTSAELMGSGGMGLREVASAGYFISGCVFAVAALTMFAVVRISRRLAPAIVPAVIALGASVSLSHAASRMDHRALLLALTAAHHLGMAAWIGALLFLLLVLRTEPEPEIARAMARRFSPMAVTGVALLVGAGAGLSWFYAGSWRGMWGTSYGLLLSTKIVLTMMILALGAANYFAIRQAGDTDSFFLRRLRRFGEVELAVAFTVLVAAASLTAQTPSVDEMPENTLTTHELLQRLEWRVPSFRTPSYAQLTPATPLSVAVREATFTGGSKSDANDSAWSEYNHHWAGLIVLAAGLLALTGRRWAQHWPLLFVALAVFIILRADPECWPLGPRPFWASFTAPDVLEHRVFALLIAAFALFEWGVRTGRLGWAPARYVFPALCVASGALLLTHTHAQGEGTGEVFAELSHTPMAVLGATVGWARWLELRLSEKELRARRVARWVWPVCLVLLGLLLLSYRET